MKRKDMREWMKEKMREDVGDGWEMDEGDG
jgi:hypothetical protein